MTSDLFIRLLRFAVLLIIAGAVLFAEYCVSPQGPAWLRWLAIEVRAVMRDPGTQWMVFLCAGIYFVTFTVLSNRGWGLGSGVSASETVRPRTQTPDPRPYYLSPNFWLCGILLIAALAYAFDYSRASTSTQALVLLAGAAIGKGARLWVNWGKTEKLKSEKRKAESGTSTPHPRSLSPVEAEREAQTGNIELRTSNIEHRTAVEVSNLQPATFNLQLLLSVLLFLLGVASLWHPEGAMQFQYRGLNRWSGPWDNPNIFGILIGVGVVIGAGLFVSSFGSQVSGSAPWKRWAWRVFLLGCVGCCGVGLLKSYSRGAWLGAMCGLAVLGFQAVKFQVSGFEFRVSGLAGGDVLSRGSRSSRFISWLGRNRLPIFILLACVLVLSFWQFRQTEWHPARRVFSVGNVNDFSWRNRIAAWEGSLAMMADRPVAGFGWNQPEKIYDQFYRSPKVAEGMAVQLNHYFTLGMSLGLPALICFGIYVGLALVGKGKPLTPSLSPSDGERVAEGRVRGCLNDWLQTICRAGAIVLLIGLWFDGGLFNLATAAPLWVLLELGRVPVADEVTRRNPPAAEIRNPPPHVGGYTFPVSCIPRISRFQCLALPSFFAVLLFTGLFWAKARDPFHREWLSLKTPGGGRFSAVAVMPDRGGPFPVVVFAHGAGGSVETGGETLQQFASLGLAAVGIEYDKTNQANFDAQLLAVLDELGGKAESGKRESGSGAPTTKHMNGNTESAAENLQPSTFNLQAGKVAWVGNSLGAQRQLSFLAQHPERQPAVLVRLNGGWVEELGAKSESGKAESGNGDSTTKHTDHTKGSTEADLTHGSFKLGTSALRVWIAHGENDEVFPAGDARKVAEALRAAGAKVQLNIFPGRGHGFGEDQPLLVKMAAEFCAGELGGAAPVPVSVRPALWYYWLPVGLFGGFLLVCCARRGNVEKGGTKSARWLQVFASVTAVGATLISTAQLALPLFRVSPATLKLARHWCVRPELRADFDWLTQQPNAKGCRIRDLLEHLNLAGLQRGQFAGPWSENEWREFVLSPWIEGAGEDNAWRRELWEWMTPRVRRETDAEQAAIQVARQLRLRVSETATGAETRSVLQVWDQGWATKADFERLCVASMRAVGIPARLGMEGLCEILVDGRWKPVSSTQFTLVEQN